MVALLPRESVILIGTTEPSGGNIRDGLSDDGNDSIERLMVWLWFHKVGHRLRDRTGRNLNGDGAIEITMKGVLAGWRSQTPECKSEYAAPAPRSR